MMKIKPSRAIWEHYQKHGNGDITALQVVTALADINGGFHISSSATHLLKDLNLLTKKNKPNKEGRQLVAWYLHGKYFKSIDPIKVIVPEMG